MSNVLCVQCSLCGDVSHGIDAPSMVHKIGFYCGCVLIYWISSRSEEQIWLEKLPNQICSRLVECNASCLINLRT
jgi:hypothetical protein